MRASGLRHAAAPRYARAMLWTPDPDDPAAPGATASRVHLRGRGHAVLAWGEPGPEATVFLHGFLDHAGSWSRVAAGLPGWRLALDLRGHGRTDWVAEGESYHFAEYVADLDALVDALGVPITLVGHSMGGTLASLYAGARPERVRRLVVVDGLGLADGGAGARDRMLQFLDGIRRVRPHRPFPSVEEAAERLVAVWGVERGWARALARRGTRPAGDGVVWAYDPRHRVRAAVPYRQDQHRAFLAAIRCPVLSIRASRSLFSAADVAAVASAIPDLHVVTLEGGHMLQLEAPEALADTIAAFLAQD